MKKIIILTAAAFMLSVAGCSTTPESKAEYFVERIFSAFNEEDKMTQIIGEELGEYLNSIDEQRGKEFGKHFVEKFYAGSERYGYDKEFADESMSTMLYVMIGANGEGLSAFVLSALECMMQSVSDTIELKAAYFVERIFSSLNEEDWESRLTQIGEELGEYINSLDTEQQGEKFGEYFVEKIYAGSERSGYGKEFADEFLQSMIDTMLGTDGEEKKE